MIKRREFITLLGGAAAAWPLAARAQQRTMPVVGFLYAGSPELSTHLVAAFFKGLSEIGFVDGQNVRVEFSFANNQLDRLPELAANLVRRRMIVIAALQSTPAALAAKAATSTIPIIFATGVDPVQSGLVASLNRPGGNLTGIADMSGDIVPKRIGLLRELLPRASRFAFLVNMTNTISAASAIAEAHTATAAIGRELEVVTASTNREIETAFASLAEKRVDALLTAPDALFYNGRVRMATLAARYVMPTIFNAREYPLAGGLMSYGSSQTDIVRQAGRYVGRVLKGEKPADLPVERAVRFEFVLNLATARLLGIEVPPTLLAIADEVIE